MGKRKRSFENSWATCVEKFVEHALCVVAHVGETIQPSGTKYACRVEKLRAKAGKKACGDLAVEIRIGTHGNDRFGKTCVKRRLNQRPGDGSAGHQLVAILHLANGSSHRAVIRTSPIRIQEVEDVDLVNLFTVVKDKRGEYVRDLNKSQFTLLEDGKPQQIRIFSTESKPLAIAVVLDTSLSMEGVKLEAARKSALRFLSTLGEGDRGMLLTFNNRVQVLQPPTLEHAELVRAVESIGIQKRGGTALYDGIWRASDYLRRLEGRRVLVLLTDGRDETASGLEPGSLHTLVEASNHANRNDVMIFAVGYGHNLEDMDIYHRFSLRTILERLAETSGGAVLFPRRLGSLKGAFEAVTRDLRHQYNIAYTSTNKDRDGEWRTIELRTDTEGHEVVTRKGYFAPGVRAGDSEP